MGGGGVSQSPKMLETWLQLDAVPGTRGTWLEMEMSSGRSPCGGEQPEPKPGTTEPEPEPGTRGPGTRSSSPGSRNQEPEGQGEQGWGAGQLQ